MTNTAPKSAAKPKAATTPKPSNRVELTKAQLTKAAKMRDDGATWNAIREAFGVKLGSSRWFGLWEENAIAHRPAGESPKPTDKEA
jgi:hypothetical protein